MMRTLGYSESDIEDHKTACLNRLDLFKTHIWDMIGKAMFYEQRED